MSWILGGYQEEFWLRYHIYYIASFFLLYRIRYSVWYAMSYYIVYSITACQYICNFFKFPFTYLWYSIWYAMSSYLVHRITACQYIYITCNIIYCNFNMLSYRKIWCELNINYPWCWFWRTRRLWASQSAGFWERWRLDLYHHCLQSHCLDSALE
jgi:hypothetical protein